MSPNRLSCAALAALLVLASDRPAAAEDRRPESLAEAVRRALQEDPWIDASRVDVRERAPGALTLSGSVPDLLSSERAFALAQAHGTARDVEGELSIPADPLPSEQVARAIQRALRADYATRAWKVGVVVRDGEAELSGDLPSGAAKATVLDLVKRVRGVRAVSDEMALRMAEVRSDEWLLATLRDVFATQAECDLRGVIVRVDDGGVTLSGTLRAAGDLFIARRLALIEGVRYVDSSALRIHWRDAGAGWTSASVPAGHERPDDRELAERVFRRLAYHQGLGTDVGVTLTVRADDGVVRLGGKVPCLAARQLCEDLARRTHGVRDVTNVIAMETEDLSDAQLTGVVTGALHAVARLAHGGIAAQVADKKVTLRGQLQDESAWRHALQVVARIPGVAEVQREAPVEPKQPEPKQPEPKQPEQGD